MRHNSDRRWYLTALAAVYLVLCSAGCLYYASLHFRTNAGTVPAVQQALCLAFAVAAGTYVFRPRVGHRALTIVTVQTLIDIGTSDAGATGFHACVLLILLVPFLHRRKRLPLETHRTKATVAITTQPQA